MTRPTVSAVMITTALLLAACQPSDGQSDSTSNSTAASNTDTGTGTGTSTGGTTQTLEVDAGLDMVVAGGATAQLSADIGSVSGATLMWEQIAGPVVTLSDVTSTTPTFTVPIVGESTTLTFKVQLEDGTSDPATDSVDVEVWVPFDQTNLTALGDFSGHADWACEVDLGIESVYTEDAQGLETSISLNSIPNHAVGTFPNDGNPNTISEQSYRFNIPLEPVKTNTATDTRIFGVATSGVYFERETAECYNNEQSCAWRYEAITPGVASNAGGTNWAGSRSMWIGTDCNNAHVQPTGNYHYHGLPESLINALGDTGDTMTKVGVAADGFPIYARWGYSNPSDANSTVASIKASYELKSGTRSSRPGGAYSGIFLQDWEYVAGSGDLDECSGRFGVTPEHPEGIYHYYLTDDYPYVPLCVFGEVADSGFTAGPGGPLQ